MYGPAPAQCRSSVTMWKETCCLYELKTALQAHTDGPVPAKAPKSPFVLKGRVGTAELPEVLGKHQRPRIKIK